MQGPEAPPAAEVIRLIRIKVARNPGDLDAGLMLGSALYKSGDPAGSASALKLVLRQHPGHYQGLMLLARAEARSGNLAAAFGTLGRARQVDPVNSQAWQVAAALAADQRDWTCLLQISRGWTLQHPDSVDAWQALSRAHFEESRFREAIAAFTRVLELQPDNAAQLIAAARLAIAAQCYEQARQHLDAAQTLAPAAAELLYTQGRLHHMTGELATAEDCYRRAIAARPGYVTAYVELGTLCEGRLADRELQAVTQLFEDTAVHPEYRVMLGFTLGDALDRRNEYTQAFAAWDEANQINRRISEQEGIVYHPELVESELELLAGLFSGPVGPDTGPRPADTPIPVFVVGMPRSGTTLIESILASHSEVYGAGELPTLYDIHEELTGLARDQGIEAARELLYSETASWRERYFSALPPIGDATRVVDKQPLNYRSIGLIRLLFPDSPIICTQRSPMDVGLSVFRHKFSKNWPCAHSLGDIGHFYGVHARLVELWKSRYPGAIHIVDHSDLIKDPQAEIRRVLAFAKLTEQPECFTPHKTKRPVATFSSVQVRQPLSTAYSGQARHYELQLAPLRRALERAGIERNLLIDQGIICLSAGVPGTARSRR